MKHVTYIKKKGDILLLVFVGALVLIGILILSSASSAYAYQKFNDSYYFVRSQVMHLFIGLIVFWLLAKIDYHRWRPFAWYLWFISILMLILVFIPGIGIERNGVKSWVDFGFFSWQPVELVKLLLIIYFATWFADLPHEELKSMRKGFLPFMFSLGIILGLILMQPDFGTMFLMGLIIVTMFLIAGAGIKQIISLGGLVLLFIPFIIFFAPYRFARLTAFLNQEQDLSSIGYHLDQALIAIGSGGWFGRGFGGSIQKFQYLPEVVGDSIFAVFAEETGFIITTILVILFIMLLYRGFLIASFSPDLYGKLLAVGVVAWIGWQTFINIGSIIGLLPLTGLPLPFISLGGTALVSLLAGIGILFNISKQGVFR